MDRRLTLIGVLSTITMLSTIAAFSAADDKKEINVEKLTESLDMKKRKAIVDAANRASHQHMVDREKGPPSNEIAESSWGEAISELKPLRVRFDRVNVCEQRLNSVALGGTPTVGRSVWCSWTLSRIRDQDLQR